MTTSTDDLPLASDFPAATYDDWRKLVDGVLKGAPFEKLVGKTYDGLKIDPIYRRATNTAPAAGRAAATPGRSCSGSIIRMPRRPMRRHCMISRKAPPASNSMFAGGPGARGFGLADASKKTLARRCCGGIHLDAGIMHRAQSADRAAGADGRRMHVADMIEAQRLDPANLDHPLQATRRSAPSPCGGCTAAALGRATISRSVQVVNGLIKRGFKDLFVPGRRPA